MLFLQRQKLPKLSQEERNNLNTTVTSKDIESIILNLPAKKISGSDAFSSKFYQINKEEIISILHKII